MTATAPGVALITGAARGIRAATARRLVDAGWRVVLVDRDAAAVAALRDRLGVATVALTLDVTDHAAVDACPPPCPPISGPSRR